jgi:protocatechuate 3,4-dioxygenase alpha subunit
MKLIPSASQTVGPFFNFALTSNAALGVLARDGAKGERIQLAFRVLDGDGNPTPGDSMVELYQADAAGSYQTSDATFSNFGRLETAANGECTFQTVKPGAMGKNAPHVNVVVFARGLLKQLYTRAYFTGDPANSTDPVLALVPEARRGTLMAKPDEKEPGLWRFTVCMQGEHETVFFDV